MLSRVIYVHVHHWKQHYRLIKSQTISFTAQISCCSSLVSLQPRAVKQYLHSMQIFILLIWEGGGFMFCFEPLWCRCFGPSVHSAHTSQLFVSVWQLESFLDESSKWNRFLHHRCTFLRSNREFTVEIFRPRRPGFISRLSVSTVPVKDFGPLGLLGRHRERVCEN